MNEKIRQLLIDIKEREDELAELLHEQQERLHYRIEGSKIRFEENLRRFLTAKIFTMKSLDEALMLVDEAGRSDAFATGLAEFEAIQKELAAGGAKALYAPAMATRLAGILEKMPNNYSAKILLGASRRFFEFPRAEQRRD